MKIIASIIVLLIFSSSTYSQETEESKRASENYQDFMEDLFDDSEGEDEDEEGFSMPNYEDLKALGQAADSLGSFGKLIKSIGATYSLTEKGCSSTFICMLNIIMKNMDVFEYEKSLRENMSCKDKQKKLEDYILYIGTMNLDIYCVDHLHPDNNQLEDVDLVDIMMVFGRVAFLEIMADADMGIDPSYRDIFRRVKPYCTNDTYPENFDLLQPNEMPCSCGEFIGTIDPTEKDKVLNDIREIIDGINPIWQAQKLNELNQKLQALPCNN